MENGKGRMENGGSAVAWGLSYCEGSGTGDDLSVIRAIAPRLSHSSKYNMA